MLSMLDHEVSTDHEVSLSLRLIISSIFYSSAPKLSDWSLLLFSCCSSLLQGRVYGIDLREPALFPIMRRRILQSLFHGSAILPLSNALLVGSECTQHKIDFIGGCPLLIFVLGINVLVPTTRMAGEFLAYPNLRYIS